MKQPFSANEVAYWTIDDAEHNIVATVPHFGLTSKEVMKRVQLIITALNRLPATMIEGVK